MIITGLILVAIVVLGMIAWRSITRTIDQDFDNGTQASALKPAANDHRFGMEAAEERHPIEIGSRVAPPIRPAQPPQKEAAAVTANPYMASKDKKQAEAKHEALGFTASAVRSPTAEPVIAIIPTPKPAPDSRPITIDGMLQQLERSENKLEHDLVRELENQLSETAALLNRINQQVRIAETLHTMDEQLTNIRQTFS